MSPPPVVPVDTLERQRRASAPGASAWVSANAGSGKTWVLARRVIRLLLDGTAPSRILCLTFTRAAAATMSNRVFVELGRWTLFDDATLAAEIAAIEGGVATEVGAERLGRARRLFAEAIETPGGLKIQTIHAFCERLLQQFPLEAGLGGRFEILDEIAERDLVAGARAAALVAAGDPGSGIADDFARLTEEIGEAGLAEALDAVVAARHDLVAALRDFGTLDGVIDAVRRALAVPPGETDARLVAEMLSSPVFPPGSLDRPIADLAASGKTDRAQAERLRTAIAPLAEPAERLEAWWSVFFTQSGGVRAAVATGKILAAHPDLAERAVREAERLQRLADARAGLASFVATAALLRLGDRVVAGYEAGKRRRGALDFDDLVGRTADLLSRSDAARWVQYKLDQGIDHVLVDEAQDTSPRQWEIIRGLTDEFFAGEGARRRDRTVFAVGDEKQSIYSFQGADPGRFSDSRRDFAARAGAVSHPFADVRLNLSFRSTGDVLAAVDRVFADDALKARLLADPRDYVDHAAVRAGAPGAVEIWPMIVAEKAEEPDDWTVPLDRPSLDAPPLRLARRIADEIDRLLAPDFRLEGTGRRLAPRDVIVLVRKRGAFVDAMNRVLKERGRPVAGHDRLRLTDHIAVADLIALGRVLLLPEDDLSLAAVLKSPLFGLDDDDLVELATGDDGRRAGLSAALTAAAAASGRWRAVAERLDRWRAAAGRMPPFELYARILAADGGRRRFAARLGSEVEDVLDEFLALAAAHDRGPAPSLVRFLAGLEADAPEIKRELDETRDEIRVMTVHGAKGLEAAVVFLVDPGAGPTHASHDPTLLLLEVPGAPPGSAPVPVWSRGGADPSVVRTARAAHRDRAAAEYLRLLYVAMTRAADRLYVCGFSGVRGPAADGWHALVSAALVPEAEPLVDAAGTVIGHRWRAGPAVPLPPVAAVAAEPARPVALPEWIERPPPFRAEVRRLLPSAGIGDEALTEEPIDPAVAERRRIDRLRGSLAHRLLELLPGIAPEARRAAALRLFERRGGDLPEDEREPLLGEVERVMAEPGFAAVFGERARAEVPIVGRLDTASGPLEISGRIDRLVIGAEEILIVDFKTDRRPPAQPPTGHVEQLALYGLLLDRLYPGRRLRAAILWTALPRLDAIPPDRLAAVAHRIAAT
jgi:ATP-dependent helicase/nuclease subunit A